MLRFWHIYKHNLATCAGWGEGGAVFLNQYIQTCNLQPPQPLDANEALTPLGKPNKAIHMFCVLGIPWVWFCGTMSSSRTPMILHDKNSRNTNPRSGIVQPGQRIAPGDGVQSFIPGQTMTPIVWLVAWKGTPTKRKNYTTSSVGPWFFSCLKHRPSPTQGTNKDQRVTPRQNNYGYLKERNQNQTNTSTLGSRISDVIR